MDGVCLFQECSTLLWNIIRDQTHEVERKKFVFRNKLAFCNDVRRDIPVPTNTNKVGGISTVSRYLLVIREITKLLRNNRYTTIWCNSMKVDEHTLQGPIELNNERFQKKLTTWFLNFKCYRISKRGVCHYGTDVWCIIDHCIILRGNACVKIRCRINWPVGLVSSYALIASNFDISPI